MLKGRRAVQLRADLMDCHIAICAPEVLVDFRENFDYQQLRRDFVGGVLIDEAMGNKIFVHELAPAEYAARVHHLRAYDAISRDIIHRWVYPFVPDNSIVPALKSTPGYVYARGNMYRHLTAGPDGGAGIARSAVVGRDTVVGAACTVGEHTQLHSCVIGAGCVIGANCKLEGCYLDAGVTVGDGCVLTSAMVLGGAMLHPNATLEEGVILSYNVVVGAGHTVKAHTRLSLRKQEDFEEYDDSDEELEVSGPSLAGKADAGKVPEAGGLSVALDRANLSAAKAGMTAPRSNMQWDATVVGHGGAGYVWVPRGAEPRAGEEGDTDSAEQQDEIARYSIVARARAADAVIRWESDDEDEVPR
jgi:translation initiation factor eIF-2B subunit epsilon